MPASAILVGAVFPQMARVHQIGTARNQVTRIHNASAPMARERLAEGRRGWMFVFMMGQPEGHAHSRSIKLLQTTGLMDAVATCFGLVSSRLTRRTSFDAQLNPALLLNYGGRHALPAAAHSSEAFQVYA